MSDRIEEAVSGRAKCRKCKDKIEKGALRFGEVDYSFSESGTYKWFHLSCAAAQLPTKLGPALQEFAGEVPDRDQLELEVAKGRRGKAFPRGELAPSGRAGCLVCDAKIKKGELRLAVEREVDTGSFVAKRPGYVHPACAKGSEYVSEAEDLAGELRENSDLDAAQLDGLLQAVCE